MPTSVADLFSAASITKFDVVRWGERVGLAEPGVYVVAQTLDAHAPIDAHPAKISMPAVEALLDTRPELRIDGVRPTSEQLGERLSSFWLPDEPVVYIGLAGTSVRSRVGAYYRTPLGARRPHGGGWFLKVLADLDQMYVHFAPVVDTNHAEGALLASFCAGVSESTRSRLRDPDHPFPFANLEWPPGTRKRHGITGARAPKDT